VALVIPEPSRVNRDPSSWSYGAELELSDWAINSQLPPGCKHDQKDSTIVNSNGVANDPSGRLWGFGGEINTRPTKTIHEQVQIFKDIFTALPDATVNYKSNLHIHVMVPGLAGDLQMLKKIQTYCTYHLRQQLNIIDPLPLGRSLVFAERKRRKRSRVSRHTTPSLAQLTRYEEAKTLKEFYEAEPPINKTTGKPMWHAAPRAAVNLRQLMDVGTVEFRCFAGTDDPDAFYAALTWCHDFLYSLLDPEPFAHHSHISHMSNKLVFPKQLPFDARLQEGWELTNHGGKNKKSEIETNIEKVLSWNL